MNEKDLKRMTRSELLEILIEQAEENKKLKLRLQRAEKLLEERKIILDNAGSIAEASMMLSGIFDAAEEASRLYLDSVQLLSERSKAIYENEEELARLKAEAIVEEALDYKRRVYAEADAYKRMVYKKAKRQLSAERAPHEPIREQDGDE